MPGQTWRTYAQCRFRLLTPGIRPALCPVSFEEPDEPLPRFMTNAMREKISETCMDDVHVQRIRKYLRDPKSACDDQHQFNPSEFDMENCMRINLKPD